MKDNLTKTRAGSDIKDPEKELFLIRSKKAYESRLRNTDVSGR
jgi:hypothetical protein